MTSLQRGKPGSTRYWTLGIATLCAVALGGCFTESGMLWTSDSYTYVSSSWQPKTVTLVDTRSGQEFWTVEVPVGKKLVVSFAEKEGTSDGFTPDGMKWAIIDPTEDFPRLGNQLPVPPKDVRRLDVTIRPTPELPEGMTPKRAAAVGSGN